MDTILKLKRLVSHLSYACVWKFSLGLLNRPEYKEFKISPFIWGDKWRPSYAYQFQAH